MRARSTTLRQRSRRFCQILVLMMRPIDVRIGRIRRGLSKLGGSNVIRTAWSRGYALDFDD